MVIATADRSKVQDGVVLVGSYKGETYRCDVVDVDGRLAFVLVSPGKDGATPRPVFASPSAAGGEVTGSNVNGWRFWSIDTKAKATARSRAAAAKYFDGAAEPAAPVATPDAKKSAPRRVEVAAKATKSSHGRRRAAAV